MSELNVYLFEENDFMFTEKCYLGIVSDGRGFYASLDNLKHIVKCVRANKNYSSFEIYYMVKFDSRKSCLRNLKYLGKVTDELVDDLILIRELKK